jgi:hypothetical protein
MKRLSMLGSDVQGFDKEYYPGCMPKVGRPAWNDDTMECVDEEEEETDEQSVHGNVAYY